MAFSLNIQLIGGPQTWLQAGFQVFIDREAREIMYLVASVRMSVRLSVRLSVSALTAEPFDL